MADSNIIIRSWLLSNPTITQLLGTSPGGSVYGVDLIEAFDPKLGPGVTVSTVGGMSNPEITTIDDELKQIRVWADVNGYQAARKLYTTIKKVLHGACGVEVPGAGAYVLRCQEVLSGQDITDLDTGWATVMGRFQLMFRDLP